MKKAAVISAVAVLLRIAANAASEGAVTEDPGDITRLFLNIDLYMFAGALILLAASTAVMLYLKARKKDKK